MTKPRETKYARELASAKLPSGLGGKPSVAFERLPLLDAAMHAGVFSDAFTQGLRRLVSESWSRAAPGSGQLHEITPQGASLLGEGFI
jgi:hypothetical protein